MALLPLADGRSAASWQRSYAASRPPARRRASAPAANVSRRRRSAPAPQRSYGPSRSNAGGATRGVARARAVGGRAVAGGRAPARASTRARYAGPPPPSAEMISQLYEQMGGIRRRRSQTNADYNFGRSQLFAGRDLFVKQLQDTYRQRQQNLASDYANRGLAQSGLVNEALANLGREQAGERGAYETNVQQQIADMLRQTTSTNADLNAQGSALNQRFNKARADRARILQLMGG